MLPCCQQPLFEVLLKLENARALGAGEMREKNSALKLACETLCERGHTGAGIYLPSSAGLWAVRGVSNAGCNSLPRVKAWLPPLSN